MSDIDYKSAIEEIAFVNKLDEKQEIIKEYKTQLKTIKCILYKHALLSEFQFAEQEFKKQLNCLDTMYEAFENTL